MLCHAIGLASRMSRCDLLSNSIQPAYHKLYKTVKRNILQKGGIFVYLASSTNYVLAVCQLSEFYILLAGGAT
jgi:hypothetical protein